MTKLGNTDLDVYGLNLGGNVFGWTADEPQSFAVLDAYTAAGGNFVDSADLYGGGGGSEEILGNWLAARGNRDDVVVATKVGMWDGRPGLSAKNIEAAAEDSLRRLKTDHIDLYYAHRDDPDTPLEETLTAFDALVRAGKVRYLGASNYNAERLTEALSISTRTASRATPCCSRTTTSSSATTSRTSRRSSSAKAWPRCRTSPSPRGS